jgi:hypothetical protein
LIFLAHFSGTPLNILFEMDGNDVHYWFVEALKLHEKMNPQPE